MSKTIRGIAYRMRGCPMTEQGRKMRYAQWFRLVPACYIGEMPVEHMIVTTQGGYRCDEFGRIVDWTRHLVPKGAVRDASDVLRTIDYEVSA